MAFFKDETISDLTSLQDRMNGLFSDALKRIREFTDSDQEKTWSPPVDVFETGDSFILVADLPGVAHGAVNVEVRGATLSIKGDRVRPSSFEGADIHRTERQYGGFERSFNLPANVDSENIKARLEDGVLTVTLRKSNEGDQSIRVEVD